MRRSSTPFGSRFVGNGLLAAIVLGIGLVLAGCATTTVAVRPSLPVMPGTLASRCVDPGVRAGQPALIELARNRQALASCSRKQADGVAFYNDLRRRLGK
ncbi:MAG: hypothetical protein J0H94_03825 [Rhizobiales bacterium]|nr:hypothetical protein [Hyphomicrobiales bacterium]